MWNSLSQWEKIGFCFILMGSIVDLFQFMWLIRSWITKAKKTVHDRIKKEILLEQLEINKQMAKDKFVGIKLGDNE